MYYMRYKFGNLIVKFTGDDYLQEIIWLRSPFIQKFTLDRFIYPFCTGR
jgi:hypothetical protein